MSQDDRLTRQELAWLLTQEARSAAQTLRKGVAVLSQPPEVISVDPQQQVLPAPQPNVDVVSSLDTLDDAMKMLASLHGGGGTSRGRRGRIDLAALLCELAPDARLHIEPGSGTEVFGDEAELRRMLQVLLAQSSGTRTNQTENPEVHIERTGSEVRVSCTLGPDTMGARGTEHAWLSRMALRYGGRLELEGRQENLIFPAEGAQERKEVEALRKELEEAQRQGEAYARELAAVFASGGEMTPVAPSTIPPSAGSLPGLAAIASAVSAELRAALSGMSKDIEALGQKGADTGRICEDLQRHLATAQDVSTELGRVGKIAIDELPAAVNVASMLRDVITDMQSLTFRRSVEIAVEGPDRADAVIRPTALRALLHALVRHAVEATPRNGTLRVGLTGSDREVVITVDDSGAAVPSGTRDALLWRRVDPASLGRPIGAQLFIASALASHLNGILTFDDAPGGGNRTRTRLPVL
ncbi:MAG: HAMP domain-containing histidine kinase [Deltaproteobacteria bacterium]|nr:HAMP domain-containing histidine kinase [Deltaproteobacteria bacterium]